MHIYFPKNNVHVYNIEKNRIQIMLQEFAHVITCEILIFAHIWSEWPSAPICCALLCMFWSWVKEHQMKQSREEGCGTLLLWLIGPQETHCWRRKLSSHSCPAAGPPLLHSLCILLQVGTQFTWRWPNRACVCVHVSVFARLLGGGGGVRVTAPPLWLDAAPLFVPWIDVKHFRNYYLSQIR